jgi:hypothetical protein
MFISAYLRIEARNFPMFKPANKRLSNITSPVLAVLPLEAHRPSHWRGNARGGHDERAKALLYSSLGLVAGCSACLAERSSA